jgi:outer membrane protein OmpA-like peptidoglycan-associated protein
MGRKEIVLATLVALAMGGCGQSEARSADVPKPPAREQTAFSNTTELLESIEDETFAERVGLTDELEAAKLATPVDIAFVAGTAIPEDQEPELEELAARLQSNELLTVQIIGCSDPSGPKAVNLRISQQRAESVAARLSALGVPSARIEDVAGRGEACEPPERVVHVIPSFAGEPDTAIADRDASPRPPPATGS